MLLQQCEQNRKKQKEKYEWQKKSSTLAALKIFRRSHKSKYLVARASKGKYLQFNKDLM